MDTRVCAGPSARLFFAGLVLLMTALASLTGCESRTDATQVGTADGDVPSATVSKRRPNILVIVVDDMGFSDLGSFGGEIPTPNLDALAERGTRFTDFQVLPACSPTRAVMLTGREPHAVGFGSLAEELADNQKGKPAYAGELPVDVTTLPRLLGISGYNTYMAGKWHLGYEAGRGPAYFGFERSVAMLDGGASHFVDMQPAYSPDPEAVARYTIDDRLITELPENFEYSSQFYADTMIDFVGENRQQPFFGYLSFTAPHWPLQAPDAAIAAFDGAYDTGYEVLREARLERMKALGLVPDATAISPLPPAVVPWEELDPDAQARESRAMAVYAAMIAEVDRHVGRVVDHLEAVGELENTIVWFFSDNGPEGHDLDETWPGDLFPDIRAVIDSRFDHSTAGMGRPNSYTLYGAGWAHAGSPHLRLYKGFPTEGGTRVTSFLTLPANQTAGISHGTTGVRDVMPTLLELARIPVPASTQASLVGRSITPMLATNAALTGPDIAIEFLGKHGIRQGQWKLVRLPEPYGTGDYTLHDLEADPGEAVDVASEHPEVVAALLALYQRYATAQGVIEPDWVSGY